MPEKAFHSAFPPHPEIALLAVVVVQDDREVLDRLDGRHGVEHAALRVATIRLFRAI